MNGIAAKSTARAMLNHRRRALGGLLFDIVGNRTAADLAGSWDLAVSHLSRSGPLLGLCRQVRFPFIISLRLLFIPRHDAFRPGKPRDGSRRPQDLRLTRER